MYLLIKNCTFKFVLSPGTISFRVSGSEGLALCSQWLLSNSCVQNGLKLVYAWICSSSTFKNRYSILHYLPVYFYMIDDIYTAKCFAFSSFYPNRTRQSKRCLQLSSPFQRAIFFLFNSWLHFYLKQEDGAGTVLPCPKIRAPSPCGRPHFKVSKCG